MIKKISVSVSLLILSFCFSQNSDIANKKLVSVVAEDACRCIDSLNVSNKNKTQINSEINNCINKRVEMLIVMTSFKDAKKRGKVDLKKAEAGLNPNSETFKSSYNEIEQQLMDSCYFMKQKVAASDMIKENSFSKNTLAMAFYHAGEKDFEKEKLG